MNGRTAKAIRREVVPGSPREKYGMSRGAYLRLTTRYEMDYNLVPGQGYTASRVLAENSPRRAAQDIKRRVTDAIRNQ